jgi:hypothetical protein
MEDKVIRVTGRECVPRGGMLREVYHYESGRTKTLVIRSYYGYGKEEALAKLPYDDEK